MKTNLNLKDLASKTSLPDLTKMSKDRWTVYSTDGEYLFRDSGYKVE